MRCHGWLHHCRQGIKNATVTRILNDPLRFSVTHSRFNNWTSAIRFHTDLENPLCHTIWRVFRLWRAKIEKDHSKRELPCSLLSHFFFALGPHPCYDTIFIKAINDLLLNPLDTFQPYYRPIGINWPHFILSLYSTLCSMSLISSDFIPFLLYNSFNFWFHSFFHMFLESWYLWGTFSQSYPFLIRTVSVVVIHSHRC